MFCSRCGTEVQVSSRFCPTCGLDLTTITQGMTASQPAAPAGGQQGQPDEADIVRDALKDEYDLEKELGRGGMAIVFKARDKALEREVAIKVLPFSLSFDAEFVERFQREARTAAKLEHPNIIPIYRVGKSGRVIYFVMKFVRGKSLSTVIETRGALPVPELRRVMIECARALGFAHRHGIVHRDIKPDNIMFDELGQAIVMDFGIAKAQSGARLTGTGMSIGTPHYMSPEQARAQNLDGRSDVYSLGVVAYQCLSGHVPFDGEDSFSIGYKHIMEELPVPPLETADQRELFGVIQKMMAKKPEDRYQTADEAVHALELLGGAGRASLADMATMPTLAIEPPVVKRPAAADIDKTTPLPRASGPVARPSGAGAPAGAKGDAAAAGATRPLAPPPGAKPAAPPARPKPSFRPAQKPRSKAPFVALGGVGVVAAALGAYMLFGRGPGKQTAQQPPADTAQRVAIAPDTTKAHAPASSTATATPSADTARRTPQTTPPRTTTTPQRTATGPATNPPRTTTPSGAVRPGATPGTGPAAPPTGGTGNLFIQGVPDTARIFLDGQRGGMSRIGVPSGRHQLRIEAGGFQPYAASVDVHPGRTTTHRVTMVRAGATATGPAPAGPAPGAQPGAAPQASPTTPGPRCENPSFGVMNFNGICYTTRPVARTAAMAARPASCVGRLEPANVLLRITPAGDVEVASIRRSSRCQAFDDAALAVARDLAFTPATKGGAAVAAWIVLPIQPARQ